MVIFKTGKNKLKIRRVLRINHGDGLLAVMKLVTARHDVF